MGVGLCCFGQLSPQRLPKEDRDDDQSHCLFMKLRRFWLEKEGKERQMHQNDQKQKDRLKLEERHWGIGSWLSNLPVCIITASMEVNTMCSNMSPTGFIHLLL
ncbi:hypothetical protein SLE2022_018850 [Rubroshorea leprosula]